MMSSALHSIKAQVWRHDYLKISELTSWGTDGWSISSMRDDEEGLDEGAQGIDNVSEYFSGVLLHVIRLAERTERKEKEQRIWETGFWHMTAYSKKEILKYSFFNANTLNITG